MLKPIHRSSSGILCCCLELENFFCLRIFAPIRFLNFNCQFFTWTTFFFPFSRIQLKYHQNSSTDRLMKAATTLSLPHYFYRRIVCSLCGTNCNLNALIFLCVVYPATAVWVPPHCVSFILIVPWLECTEALIFTSVLILSTITVGQNSLNSSWDFWQN